MRQERCRHRRGFAALNNRQKRCYAAHTIAIMFIDGKWKGSEQEFMNLVT